MNLQIEGVVVTHAGRVHYKNEDNYYLFGKCRQDIGENVKKDVNTAIPQRTAAAVFDGMGGEEAGETAALMAAKMFAPCALEQLKEEAESQILAVNEAICEERKKRGNICMGTTIAAIYLDHNTAVSCNVGDSRCYFLRDGILCQMSVDHSEGRRMIDLGILSEEESRKSKYWHVLTQHLGIFLDEFMIEPHFGQMINLLPGDVFLLCTDGLTDMVMDEEIGDILRMSVDAEEKAKVLMQTALAYGGKDNVTVLILQVEESVNSIS